MDYEYSSILRRFVRGLIPAIPLVLIGRQILTHPPESMGIHGVIIAPLVAIVFFGIAGAILAGPIASFLAQPVANLFFPNDSEEKPPPLYSVPEWLVKEGRFDEAIEEYERIIRYHPQEVQAHMALIRLYQNQKPDVEKESKAFQRALKQIKDPLEKQRIQRTRRTSLGE